LGNGTVEKLSGFLSEDAVYTDPTRGVHTGLDAIKRLFKAYLQATPSTTGRLLQGLVPPVSSEQPAAGGRLIVPSPGSTQSDF
jgi:hypothetical protein